MGEYGMDVTLSVGLMAVLLASCGPAAGGDPNGRASATARVAPPLAGALAMGANAAETGGQGGQVTGPDSALTQLGNVDSSFVASTDVAEQALTGEECPAIREMAPPAIRPVDILWVVDGSASMLDEQLRISENIQGFAADISSAGIDHHVVILTTTDLALGTALGADPNHYLFVPTAVGSSDAYRQLLLQHPLYASFLRPNASTHIIVVTDDESDTPADVFRTEMESVLGHEFIQHAIASETVPGSLGLPGGLLAACPGAFRPGVQYYALAQTTGGETISICEPDWSIVFGRVKEAVLASAPLPCAYPLPEPPTGTKLDPQQVNVDLTNGAGDTQRLPLAEAEGDCGNEFAWYYDDPLDPTTIHLCPETCASTAQGGTLDIAWGCETLQLQ